MKKIVVAIGLFGLCCLNSLQSQVVSTFAGPLGMQGDADGVGIAASFAEPDGICSDASGNFYVADYQNNKIRKITPAGVVTTLAGSGTMGSADGTGTAASFYYPAGICTDASGNIYVADQYNHKIRKITPTGVVTTFAGSGTLGSVNGTGTAASFNFPYGMCCDASGNLYVSERDGHRIRKISIGGVVTTLAGSGSAGFADGSGTAAVFYSPKHLCVDASGNIFVADQGNDRIRKITPAGVVSTFAGSGVAGSANGTGTAASFYDPTGICCDASGTIYVTDYLNYKIRKITSAGVVTTLAGSGAIGVANGPGATASFNRLYGICVGLTGDLYAASTPCIKKITTAGMVSVFVGGGGNGSEDLIGNNASFKSPNGIYSDAVGNVYVSEASKIRKITPAAVVSTFAGSSASGNSDGPVATASFDGVSSVCFDPSGNMYVADKYNHKIRKITSAGVVSTFAGSGTSGSTNGTGIAASFNYPVGVCSDVSGNIYVTDELNNNVRKITPAGVVSTLAGSGSAGSSDGTGISASFNSPRGICIDVAGNLYVTDLSNHKIRKITSTGVVSTFAGSGSTGQTDGTGTAATFYLPSGICIDASGNLYVVGSYSFKIRKITSAGVVTTFAGMGTNGAVDGPVASATFGSHSGICMDPSGNLYITEIGHHKIRKISPPCTTPLEPVDITPIANTKVCAGNTTTLTATSTGTVNWFTTPTGSSAIATGTTITTSSTLTAGTYTYYAEAITCTVSASRAVISFTVNSVPTISVNSGAICSGNSFSITPVGASTYSITGGSFNVSPTATTNYSVTGTSAQGCISSNVAVSTVSVNLIPAITVNSGAVCSGKTFSIVPGGASTYTISGGAFSVSPTVTTNYSITGTSSQGCVGSNVAVSTVSVNSSPTITANSGSICSGKSFTVVPGGANTYTISGGMFNVSPTATTNYSVTGTSALGCVSSNTAISTVSVNALPIISVTSSQTVMCVGQTATLTAGGGTTYTWSTGAGGPVLEVSPTVTTNYTVTGINSNGCSAVAGITQNVNLCTGVEDYNSLLNTVMAYPNPNSGLFTLSLPVKAQVLLLNTLGQVILTDVMEEGNHTLDIRQETPGMYIIKVIFGNRQYNSKLIKN